MCGTFKPMKAPNQQVEGKNLKEQTENLPLPLIASYKLDGIRCIFKDGNMYSCSLKNIPNEKLHERFALLKGFSKDNDIILDGELYAPSIPFNELSGVCRRLSSELPDDLSFYCFDVLASDNFGPMWQESFKIRKKRLFCMQDELGSEYFKVVDQVYLETPERVVSYFNEAVDFGCDGLILRDPEGQYKYGRSTLKEGLIFKLKPYQSIDVKIIGFVQATKVNSKAEKKINELGRSVTSKKKDDRILIDKAACFKVMYQGKELKVSIALPDKEKEYIWKNQEEFLNRTIQYKGLIVGSKERPRHATFERYRDDKD